MKAIGKISAALAVVLLVLANLSFAVCSGGERPATQPQHEGLGAAKYSPFSGPLFCHAEQKTGPASQQASGSLYPKYPFAPGNASIVVLHGGGVLDAHYFKASRYLLTALEVSDIIFPFHHFW